MAETFEQRVDATARMLLAACREQGIPLTGDLRVNEAAAAALLNISAGHLKNMRTGDGSAPRHYRIPVAGCQVSYRSRDIAIWIEIGTE
ncbi:hypothetical protein D3C80_1524500 [compost metagenome]